MIAENMRHIFASLAAFFPAMMGAALPGHHATSPRRAGAVVHDARGSRASSPPACATRHVDDFCLYLICRHFREFD